MDDPTAIRNSLLEFVKANVDETGSVDETTDLLSEGVIDSLLVADLTVHIESKFNIKLSVRDISPSNFRSIGDLTRLVVAKQHKTRSAA